MSRFSIAIALTALVSCWLVPSDPEAVAMTISARDSADGIDMVAPVPVQFAPEPRSRTEYGELRARRLPPACHWERNYKTGTSAWVCRMKEGYDTYPRYPRIVPRYQERRRP
jgi:hypothetical protein